MLLILEGLEDAGMGGLEGSCGERGWRGGFWGLGWGFMGEGLGGFGGGWCVRGGVGKDTRGRVLGMEGGFVRR